ncbi:MAG: hypothetical protein A3K19_25450 [Lentisphaerae bacterium RIFOXYB12_FULL_65_16]|nr:MAG: hypothetical protein A3K18_15305 [Lentisphaerae bacterium RIFOXYA12_64_32]OGV84879.1 MAG: hypothetical protein A3K19_25450 [Lentisphaerae bacterium RIFOXYB12_FULL_65_16]
MLNQDVARLMHEETIDGYGAIRTTPDGDITADSWQEFTITYTAPAPIAKGGSLRLTIPHCFSTPQTDAPALPGFVRATVTPAIDLSITIDVRYTCIFFENGHTGKFGKSIFVVFNEPVPQGATLTLRYGDRSTGAPGAKVPYFNCTIYLLAAIDPHGDRRAPYSGYSMLADQCGLRIVGKRASAVRLVLPSVINGDASTGTAQMVDALGNIDRGFAGTLQLISETPGVTVAQPLTFTPQDGGAKSFQVINPSRRDCVVEAVWDDGYGSSNPSVARDDGHGVYWGDYHVHTYASDGLGTAREALAHARDTGCFNFAATADHEILTKYDWAYAQTAVQDAYRPHAFATLLGFEVSVHELSQDYCLISANPDLNLDALLDFPTRHKTYHSPVVTLAEFYRMMDREDIIIVPHFHCGHGKIFDHTPPANLRLAEIYSCWGNHEYEGCPLPSYGNDHKLNTIHNLLAKGWRCGLVAGSDSHAGQGGPTTDWLRSRQRYRGGLTAIVAKELTRESLWEALLARRTYATTGARIYVDFRINGQHMGSELKIRKDEKLQVRLKVHGTVNDFLVELFENNRIVRTIDVITYPYPPALGRNGIVDTEFTLDGITDSRWYYVRVSQRDWHLAWSSPIWVDVEG